VIHRFALIKAVLTPTSLDYVRFTACDENDDYFVVGGCDHAVGQESEEGRFAELEQWTRERFSKAGSVGHL